MTKRERKALNEDVREKLSDPKLWGGPITVHGLNATGTTEERLTECRRKLDEAELKIARLRTLIRIGNGLGIQGSDNQLRASEVFDLLGLVAEGEV